MEQLIRLFNQVDPLSEESREFMRQHLSLKNVQKGDYLFERGAVCTTLGYVQEGVFRVLYCNEQGEERTKYFISEGHFAVDIESFNNSTPAEEYLEALTDCHLVVITRKAFILFQEKIPNFSLIVHRLTEKALLEKLKNRSEMVSDDAPTRYAKLMQRHPHIIRRVPLGIISSYLGISPYTLSRIRKQHI